MTWNGAWQANLPADVLQIKITLSCVSAYTFYDCILDMEIQDTTSLPKKNSALKHDPLD